VLAESNVAAQARELTKVYGEGETRVVAVDRVSIGFRQPEYTAIMGPSGSGKSSLPMSVAGREPDSACWN
jgi:putative ABC transport system ATP-binding protein